MSETIAHVEPNTVRLEVDELERLLLAQSPEVRAQALGSVEALERLVRGELVRRAILAEAIRENWHLRPEVVAQIEQAREQLVLGRFMAALTEPPADYPGEAEIAAFYAANPASFQRPQSYRLAQIYVPRPGAGAEDAASIERLARRIGEIARRARAPGADFGLLARTVSAHSESAARDGDMGWIAETNLIPEVRLVMPGLASGEVSNPIATLEGWHIVKLLEVRPAGVAPLEEVRRAIVNTLRYLRVQAAEQAYVDQLVARAPMTVERTLLERFVRDAAG